MALQHRLALVTLLAGLVITILAYSGAFYQTGSQWFDVCWQNLHGSPEGAVTARQAVRVAKCEPTFERAVYGRGFVFAGKRENAVTPELRAFHDACPSLWSDVPMSGGYVLGVDLIVKGGGPNVLDRLLPPSRLIVRVMEERWPECPIVRERSGIPKLVSREGEWVFESPCIPCEAEKRAVEQD